MRGYIKNYVSKGEVEMKVAFLDRDGTIIRDYEDKQWAKVSEPSFLDQSIAGLQKLQALGYEIIIITNQYTIGEGIITIQQYQEFSDKFLAELGKHGIQIKDTFYCADARASHSYYLKPNVGLVINAIKKYPSILLEEAIFTGDSKCDYEIANRLGIQFYKIGMKEGDELPEGVKIFTNLLAVAEAIF